ncbi:Hypothetical protein SMAX5B_020284 [Scophthalmus maximus]|uniref:Uncharacterized protein n=1 Tax=Scophthalmus maximus TaxID=52904 RepID=A0A2U9CLK1_SCOMX|nr:Hypothetical protein SMAX5B_020284 [Scophthalmus maximus]
MSLEQRVCVSLTLCYLKLIFRVAEGFMHCYLSAAPPKLNVNAVAQRQKQYNQPELRGHDAMTTAGPVDMVPAVVMAGRIQFGELGCKVINRDVRGITYQTQ